MKELTLDWCCGTIGGLGREAVNVSSQTGYLVKFSFNGVMVKVSSKTQINGIFCDRVANAVQNYTKYLDLSV